MLVVTHAEVHTGVLADNTMGHVYLQLAFPPGGVVLTRSECNFQLKFHHTAAVKLSIEPLSFKRDPLLSSANNYMPQVQAQKD